MDAYVDTDDQTDTDRSSIVAVFVFVAVVVIVVAMFGWWLIGRESFRSTHFLVYQCQPGHELVVRDGFGQHTPMCVGDSEGYWPERVWRER